MGQFTRTFGALHRRRSCDFPDWEILELAMRLASNSMANQARDGIEITAVQFGGPPVILIEKSDFAKRYSVFV